MIPIVLAVLLGVTAVLLAHKRAWAHVVMAGLLAMGAVYVAAQPLAPPTRLVVDWEAP